MMRRQFGYRSPWRDFERLQQEMNRVFADSVSGFGPRVAPDYPAVNVWANDEGVILTAELPGLTAESIDISVVGETLTLGGEREPETLGENDRYHRRERGFGKFKRTVHLPFSVDSAKVEALFDKGILQISLPRAEADKPKKISVKSL